MTTEQPGYTILRGLVGEDATDLELRALWAMIGWALHVAGDKAIINFGDHGADLVAIFDAMRSSTPGHDLSVVCAVRLATKLGAHAGTSTKDLAYGWSQAARRVHAALICLAREQGAKKASTAERTPNQ